MRKLTKADIELLMNWGYLKEDITDIQYRLPYLRCYLYNEKDGSEVRISRKKAIELIGREQFLSGLGRCAFHWDALKIVEGTNLSVFFDMSKYFRS